MKAIEVISDAIDPKRILSRDKLTASSLVKMANRLWPTLGWRHVAYGFEIEHGGKLWRVRSKPPGAEIYIYTRPWRDPEGDWEFHEMVPIGSWQSLLRHLKMFGLPIREAIDPKRVFKDVARSMPQVMTAPGLHSRLHVSGWEWEAVDGGPLGYWYKEVAPPNRDWMRYHIKLVPDGGATLSRYRLNADNRWVGLDRLFYANEDELFDRLHRLRLG